MSKEDGGMDALREVATLLYGDGADELITKLANPEQKDRRKRAATAGLSAVGAGAGLGGLALSAKEMRHGYKEARGDKDLIGPRLSRGRSLKRMAGNKKLAVSLLPLEAAGLSGELMATKILHGDTKKIAKMEPTASDLSVKSTARKYALKKINETPQINQVKTEIGRKAKEKIGKSFTWEGEFSKIDEDKRQVFGWASIVEKDGEPIYDLQGDYIDKDEIEKSAYDYVIKSRKGGDMHRRNADNTPVHSSDMIESFMVTPEKISKMGLPDNALPTGWWVGFQVNDDEAWNLVKSGRRTAFSIHGRGSRTPMESG